MLITRNNLGVIPERQPETAGEAKLMSARLNHANRQDRARKDREHADEIARIQADTARARTAASDSRPGKPARSRFSTSHAWLQHRAMTSEEARREILQLAAGGEQEAILYLRDHAPWFELSTANPDRAGLPPPTDAEIVAAARQLLGLEPQNGDRGGGASSRRVGSAVPDDDGRDRRAAAGSARPVVRRTFSDLARGCYETTAAGADDPNLRLIGSSARGGR
jgi:hypothetical protein